MMGNQTPSVAVAKGERLTDEREQGGERGESTQRLSRSEGDTIENNDNERELGVGVRREGETRSHTFHLKETFIPHIKGGSGDELS